MRILLNKNKSKKSTNATHSLIVSLNGDKRILPSSSMNTSINEVALYNRERKESNKIRLTCKINTICSNVLFNNITEIVKNEGTDNAVCLNFGDSLDLKEASNRTSGIIGKNVNFFDKQYNAIRDTQLSNKQNNCVYHCGLDIFNNHILRSKSFKTVCLPSDISIKNDFFNTIGDMMRDYNGNIINGYYDNPDTNKDDAKNRIEYHHLYLNEDLYNFEECLEEKLIEENGWYGFRNVGKFPTHSGDTILDIYKAINSRKPCDFIDMYPERDLFYFTPKYNKERKRLEKNWHYCLTYPSSSTTEVDFICQETNSLKIFLYDDTIKNMNGTDGVKFISITKHGLQKGDSVAIYNNTNGANTVIMNNVEVTNIIDDYTFCTYKNIGHISNNWYILSNEDFEKNTITVNNITYNISQDSKFVSNGEGVKFFILDKKKVSLDENVKDLSFKKIVDGEEVDYYVRIFSRLPNWKYCDTKPTEYNMYYNNGELIKKYQTIDNEFESHVSKLAFSKNIYNDDIAEIVFTDDIDISNLRDNLGRPLTEIYLTIIKNNQGYKEWYGIEGRNDRSSVNIEYSHCFGRLTCGFKLSPQSLSGNFVNSLSINNIDSEDKYKGLNVDLLHENRSHGNYEGYGCVDEYEIHYPKCVNGIQVVTIDDNGNDGVQFIAFNDNDYQGDVNFYGDLVAYSHNKLVEDTIQQIEFRFNTVQREYQGYKHSYSINDDEIFDKIYYDEIYSDDYDANGFNINNKNCSGKTTDFPIPLEISVKNGRKEGYVYHPHYKIQLKTFSDDIKMERPIYYNVKDIKKKNQLFMILTSYPHYLEKEDILMLKYYKDYYRCIVKNILGERKFECEIEGNFNIDNVDYLQLKLVKPSDTTPKYAVLSKEGSCYYMWRDIIENGFDDVDKIEQYPFTNGAFYVNKSINLFVRRQDPNGDANLQSASYPFDPSPQTYQETDNYYQEQDITC